MRSLIALVALASMVVGAAAVQTYHYPDGTPAVGALLADGHGWPQCTAAAQHSGFFTVNTTSNKKYFYWAFEPQSGRADAPVVLWMTGGPGCSSTLALLIENGPCHINMTTGDMYSNPYAWTNDAYVIYVDQPAGVGFSTSSVNGWDHNEQQVAEDMYHFMLDFMAALPQFNQSDFFVFGESYGGHYAPATAYRIMTGNAGTGNSSGNPSIRLTGLGVGNGLVAPYIQYKYYEPLAYNWCIEKLGKPCVNIETAALMNLSIPSCISEIEGCMANGAYAAVACELAYETCNMGQIMPFKFTGLNLYDIRKPCVGEMCYDFSRVTAFMNRADVQQSLGLATTMDWQTCDHLVPLFFTSDWMHAFDSKVAALLESNIRVMIYAGDVDFICNWLGNRAWTLNLEWSKKAAFNNAPVQPFALSSGAAPVAEVRTVPGDGSPILFSFVRVFDAGHMVPMDQPAAMAAVLETFLNNKPW